MKYEIRHPDWITLDIGGTPFYGYDQDWYRQERQVRAGCGPTTAAVLAAYMDRKEWHVSTDTQASALELMETMWQYVTPRMRGLYKTRWFREGFQNYMDAHQLTGDVSVLSVRPFHLMTPDAEKAARFIQEGLEADCPVAFLNLHNGGEEIFSWHWTPLVSIEKKETDWHCTIWDEGKPVVFCLAKWLKYTRFGGGFVRVTGTENSEQ